MNLRLLKLPCLLMLAATALFTACQKEGPAGPAGATGPAGPAGPTGPKGDTGVANVIYSAWLDVPFTAEVDQGDTLGFNATINATKLTAAILNNGDVKVYVNLGTTANPAVAPLPLDALLFGVLISPYFQVGKINLIASENVSTQTVAGGQKTLQYRYILIPGGTASGRMMNINWNNYAEVKAYLGLKD